MSLPITSVDLRPWTDSRPINAAVVFFIGSLDKHAYRDSKGEIVLALPPLFLVNFEGAGILYLQLFVLCVSEIL